MVRSIVNLVVNVVVHRIPVCWDCMAQGPNSVATTNPITLVNVRVTKVQMQESMAKTSVVRYLDHAPELTDCSDATSHRGPHRL